MGREWERGQGGQEDGGGAGRIMGLAKKLQTNSGNIYHVDGYKQLGTRREGESKEGTRQQKVMVYRNEIDINAFFTD